MIERKERFRVMRRWRYVCVSRENPEKQSLSCKAIYKAQYDALHPKFLQYLRNIDSLASQKIFLPGGTIRCPFLKPGRPDMYRSDQQVGNPGSARHSRYNCQVGKRGVSNTRELKIGGTADQWLFVL